MKKYLIVLFVSAILVACSDDKETSNNNPQKLTSESMPTWLTEKVNAINDPVTAKYFYAVKAEYNGAEVYLISNCCPMCNTLFQVFNADGTTIENPDPKLVINSTVIWKAENFACQL